MIRGVAVDDDNSAIKLITSHILDITGTENIPKPYNANHTVCNKMDQETTKSYRSINSPLPHSPPSLPLPAAPSGHKSFLSLAGSYINNPSYNSSLGEQFKHQTLQPRNLLNPFLWNIEDQTSLKGGGDCSNINCQTAMPLSSPYIQGGAHNFDLIHQTRSSSNGNLSLGGEAMQHRQQVSFEGNTMLIKLLFK